MTTPAATTAPAAPDSSASLRPASPRRLLAFVLLSYALAWAWWLPLALSGTTVGPGHGWPSHLPGLLAPALAAAVVTAATTGRVFVVGGGPGVSRATSPRLFAWASAVGGTKRSAALGTSSTSSRLAVTMVAVAVMPGRKARSSLSTCRMVL